MTTNRYKLILEYDGTNYAGFQLQPNVKTIASSLIQAIFNVTREDVSITCAGRTDACVHAEGQVVHFDASKALTAYQMLRALNFHLKGEAIAVTACSLTTQNFNARRSSLAKLYRYQILNRAAPSPLLANRAWHIAKPLELSAMQNAAEHLVGEHDFSSFRSSECQAKHAIRQIEYISFSKSGELICCHIKGNAFLHNMVRIIIGSLVNVGLGKCSANQMMAVLAAKDRTKAGPTAPACGLYLAQVLYPNH
jgi:tRNA pseudouridine38-40 synthase